MKNLMSVLVICWSVSALASPTAEELFNSKLKKYSIKKDSVGIYVAPSKGDALISENAGKKFIPASITKIITSSTVLANFLPGSKFKTQLLLDKKPTDGKIKGPIYLKGGGDPSFVSENMWFLVNSFKRTGVEVIDGDIIVDDSLFDAVRFDESREDTRVDRAYDAPVGAMSFNWNSVNIFVRPGKKGEKAQVFLDPESEYVKLENHAKTSGGSKINIDVSRKKAGDQDVIVVSGSIGDEVHEHVVFKNITRPDLWSGYQLKSFLAERGIKVKGEVKHGAAPEDGYLAAESESKPIEHILADMNKFSNNYVAEMLTKNLGLKKSRPGTIAGGMYVIQDHLNELGISKEEAEIYNPSGLTRDNQITPKAMWKVLDHLRDDFRVQPEFLSSLPIAGIDGTLKKRMKGTEAERWVRAKTGLLNGVVALAGYLGRKDGSVLTFVMIYNGNQDEAKVRQFYDDLLIGLAD